VLPLVPGYLGYVSGFSAQGSAKRPTTRLVIGVLLFIAGFSSVFISFSIAFASLGSLLVGWLDVIIRFAGLLVILMGFVFIGQVLFAASCHSSACGDQRFRGGSSTRRGVRFGWAPCIGPTLIAINTLALTVGDIPRAVILAVAYCIGLGLPFLLIALGFGWVTGGVAFLKRHIRAINITGGAMLMAIGVAMVSGLWQMWMSSLQAVIGGTVTPL